MNRQFPRLEVDAGRIRSNAQQIAARCRARGIAVCGVIKGVNGLPEIVRTYKEAGIAELGTSRIEQIVRCREAGIPLLRVRAEQEAVTVGPYIDESFSPCLACASADEPEKAKATQLYFLSNTFFAQKVME